MTIDRKRITAVVFALTVCATTVSSVMGQQTSTARTQPPAIIKFDGDMAAMLTHLTNIYGVTIGYEVDPRQPRSRVAFELRDPTLPDVLNAITKSAPIYQWRESGEFIEVVPVDGSSPLLDTIISNFRVNDVDEAGAIERLLNLSEMQASIRAMSLSPRALGNASTEGKGKRFSLSLEGVTLRQALNRIAKEDGAHFWIFRRERNGSFSIGNSP